MKFEVNRPILYLNNFHNTGIETLLIDEGGKQEGKKRKKGAKITGREQRNKLLTASSSHLIRYYIDIMIACEM